MYLGAEPRLLTSPCEVPRPPVKSGPGGGGMSLKVVRGCGSWSPSSLTPPWGARRWPWASPGFATAAPSGGPRPGWPPQSLRSPSRSSRVCHGPNPQPGPLVERGHGKRVRGSARTLLCYRNTGKSCTKLFLGPGTLLIILQTYVLP